MLLELISLIRFRGRLTCDGKLRPCLGSHLEFDILSELRKGVGDATIEQFIRALDVNYN